MIKLFLQILTVVLSIFGLAELLRIVMLHIFAPVPKHKSVRVICLDADAEETDLLAEAERLRWCCYPGEHRIFAVDCGILPHKKPLLVYAANQCPEILLCTPRELLSWVNAIGEPYAEECPPGTD